jgi:hypothetical protein
VAQPRTPTPLQDHHARGFATDSKPRGHPLWSTWRQPRTPTPLQDHHTRGFAADSN